MGKKIPRPRRSFRCTWCNKRFDTAFALGHHVSGCTANPDVCKHPRWRLKKKYNGKITLGTKKYKTYKVTCKRCGKYLRNEPKEIK